MALKPPLLSSVGSVKSRLIDVLSPVAKRFNLSITAFGQSISGAVVSDAPSSGRLNLSDAFGTGLEPAPITPTSGSPPWNFLSGVIRNVISTSTRETYAGKTIVVAPTILLGAFTMHYCFLHSMSELPVNVAREHRYVDAILSR